MERRKRGRDGRRDKEIKGWKREKEIRESGREGGKKTGTEIK